MGEDAGSTLGDWVLTGAAGKVGSALRPALLGRVDYLRLVDLNPPQPAAPNEAAHEVDIRDLEKLEDAVGGANGILHLAAIADEAPFDDLLSVNIVGTYNVFEAARRTSVPRVVFASTNHVTGMYDMDTPVDPSMPSRPDSMYAVTKIAGEALGRLYADKFNLEVACIRIGSSEPAPREPRHRHTWLSDHDLRAAFLAAMEAPSLGFAIFYGVSANEKGWWDLEDGARLGFDPVDNAEKHLERDQAPYSGSQGGEFSTPNYTTDHL